MLGYYVCLTNGFVACLLSLIGLSYNRDHNFDNQCILKALVEEVFTRTKNVIQSQKKIPFLICQTR